MSVFTKIKKGRIKKPLFLCMYAGPGVGKTDFGASFPKPLFFDFEESTHNIDVNRIDNITNFQEVMDALNEILQEKTEHLEFKSMIFDTIDELERMMHQHIAEIAEKQSIDSIGWQKGYDFAVNLWAKLISLCRQIRDKHGIHFVFLAHASFRSNKDIEKEETYTRYSINLHKKAASFIFGQVEMVLFAKKEVKFKTDKDGNTYAKDSDKRTLCSTLSALYDAKNRIGLPPIMPMPVKNGYEVLWRAYEKAFNETSDDVYKECVKLLDQVNDPEKKKQVSDYIDKNKKDLVIMRTSLNRINEIIGEQNDKQPAA